MVVHSRDRAHTTTLERALGERGVRVAAVAAELSDEAAVERMLDEALAVAGGIDVLYNNAAVMTPFWAAYEAVPAADFRRASRST